MYWVVQPGGAGVGGGHHDGGGLGGPAHGAGDVVVMVTSDVLILSPVEGRIVTWYGLVVQFWSFG